MKRYRACTTGQHDRSGAARANDARTSGQMEMHGKHDKSLHQKRPHCERSIQVTTQKHNRRPVATSDHRLRTRESESARRLIESTWKEEARAILAEIPANGSESRILTLIAPTTATKTNATPAGSKTAEREIDIASTLRQPQAWDVRAEPRSVSLFRDEQTEQTEQAVRTQRASRLQPVSRSWEWWQVIAPTIITIGAIWQLVWAIR